MLLAVLLHLCLLNVEQGPGFCVKFKLCLTPYKFVLRKQFVFLIFEQFFWDTLYEGWFGSEDFTRKCSIYWGGGGGGASHLTPPPKKVFIAKSKSYFKYWPYLTTILRNQRRLYIMSRNAISANPEHYLSKFSWAACPRPPPPTRPVNFLSGSTSSLPQTKNPIPHSHQKLNCLKSGVSYSSTVSLPINQEKSTPLFRQLKFWCEYRTRQNPARLITEGRFPHVRDSIFLSS